MSKLHTVLAALMGAGSVLVSATGLAQAQDAQMLAGVNALDGAVTPQIREALLTGDRARVIVMLDVTAQEVRAAAEYGPAADAARLRITTLQDAVMSRALPGGLVAVRSAGAERDWRAFPVTPGFTINADAREIAALATDPGVSGVFVDSVLRPMTDTSTAQIGATTLWGQGVNGAGVGVAILDTGIEGAHRMVSSNIVASACFNSTGSNSRGSYSTLCPNGENEQIELTSADAAEACLDADYFGDDPDAIDGCVHGTHVASTAAGRSITLRSGAVLSGVAPSADIIAVNVFSEFDEAMCADEDEPPADHPCVRSYDSDQVRALDWLYLNRDRFNLASVNMSLGGGEANTTACTFTSYDSIMGLLTDAGVAVVVAAGNDGYANGLSSPACVTSAISVGAVNDDDEVASFSNDADYLDLLAPGVEIMAALLSERPEPGQKCQLVPDTDPSSDGYCHWFNALQGTSMAAPHVAGAFALLRQDFPNTSVSDLLTALKVTGEPVMDGFTERVHARIQVDAAHDFLSNGSGLVRSVSLDDLTRYDARNTSSDISSFNTTTRAIRNTSGQSRTIRVISKPSWLTTEFFNGSGAPSGSPDSQTALAFTSAGQLRLSITDSGLADGFNAGELVLGVDGSSVRIRLKVSALVTTPIQSNLATLRFGPFEWVTDVDQDVGSIFRLVGLNAGIPASISADIERWGDQAGQTVSDVSIRCDFAIRANRFSGNEYLIGASDFTDCPRFGQGDLYIDVRVDPSDAGTVRMRRFMFNSNGGITDAAFDPAGGDAASSSQAAGARAEPVLSSRTAGIALMADPSRPQDASSPQATAQAEFGPFEWTYDANGALRSEFRLSPVLQGDTFSIDIAIANASQSGYDGDFNDCSLTIRSARRGDNDYQILPQDLADCGAFGRADLTFRVTADSSRINYAPGDIDNMRLQRLIHQTSGSLTDFHLDSQSSTGLAVTNLGNGSGQVIAGPFEWTGDSTAPTSNQFRIAGVANGAVSRIDVSIANATASGFDGDYNDCSLTIRPQRAGANDYMILREDLADCGAFGRGDLTFRIQAPFSAFASSVKVRRLAFGAEGDITDFGFDAEAGAGKTPTAISGGREEVVFGPFEWVGDAQAGTRGVFRITGIVGGLPDSIDVAIANATGGNGQYSGAYTDCSLTLRPARAGLNEFVVGAADFADCGAFGRGDVSFRIRADAAVLADTVRMRRFAVTTAGGLTDFGFDNE